MALDHEHASKCFRVAHWLGDGYRHWNCRDLLVQQKRVWKMLRDCWERETARGLSEVLISL